MAVIDPPCFDFCVENVACLGLAQQEALDAPSDRLVAYVLLNGEAILGGYHALVEAELLAGAVVAAKEMEHSVKHAPCFVNLVGLVHGLFCLIYQVQEAPEGDGAVVFHDFYEFLGACDKDVADPLPVALIPRIDHALLHLKPQAEEYFQLRDTTSLQKSASSNSLRTESACSGCCLGLRCFGALHGLEGTVCIPN